MPIKLANNASGTLATAISASDTGIALTTGNGALFPTLSAGEYFYATITSTQGTQEIVKATARSGDSLTVVRAQEGTSAAGFATGARFELRVTAASVGDAVDEVEAYALGLDTTLRANLAASTGSSLVGFQQVGTGAVVRTTQAKMRETVSVKDFGAVGDGATDDTAAVQAAINHCKSNPGFNLHFPRGAYRITTSLDCTYAGVAAATSTGYYGFTIEGEDMYNTTINGRCAGVPILDLTGKPRMTIKNIGLVNYTNDASNPSCALLLARNLTNSFGGGHLFENFSVRGYFTKIGVQTASSEVNTWINAVIEPYSETPAFALTEQITTGVNSSFIDLSAHVFSGGNTRHTFMGCAINTLYGAAPDNILMSGVDNATFIGCYSKGNGNATFKFLTGCSNVNFVDHRDESEGAFFMQIDAGVGVSGLNFTGRASRSIRCEDTSVITKSNIAPQFMATATTYSFDAYDCTESDILGMTNIVRVRNSAYRSRFWDSKQASSWSLPTGDSKCPEFYWLAYGGGASNYSRKVQSNDRYRRDAFNRIEVKTLSVPEILVQPASGNYGPDLRNGCNYTFEVAGALTVANPAYGSLGPDDGAGQILILNFKQNSTGGYAVSFGLNYDLGGATVATAAGAYTTFMFVRNSFDKWVRIR
jgi:hypothetical protein